MVDSCIVQTIVSTIALLNFRGFAFFGVVLPDFFSGVALLNFRARPPLKVISPQKGQSLGNCFCFLIPQQLKALGSQPR